MTNRIEIPLSKKKINLLLVGTLIFIIGGIWMTSNPENAGYYFNPLLRGFIYLTPEAIRLIGIIGILFFSATGIYGIIKLFDKKVGLTIDSDGIIDNSNASSIGLIEWRDISEIRTKQIASTKFLLIDVVEPEKYIGKAKNRMQAKLMKVNMNIYQTPLSITSNTLKYKFVELEKLILTEFERNKNAR